MLLLLSFYLFVITSSISVPVFQYFQQPIDHFNLSIGTFTQRYLIMDDYYLPGGPVLFICGPEHGLNQYEPGALIVPQWASQINALIVNAEHRYYGESLPFGNQSYTRENIRFLKIEQVLQDYAKLVEYISGLKNTGKIVSVGGSYGGFLSALMRIKFPHLIVGSIASAAPVLLFPDPNVRNGTWYDTVAATIANHDSECAGIISKAFFLLWSIAKNPNSNSAVELQNNLNLCCPVSTAVLGYDLMYYSKTAFSLLVEFDYSWPNGSLFFKSAFPFSKYCSAIKESPVDEFSVIRLALSMYYNSSSTLQCFPSSGSSSCGLEKAELLPEHVPGIDSVPWSYTTCFEFIQPIAVGESFFAVPHPYLYDLILKSCEKHWGTIHPQPYSFPHDDMLAVGNIVFSNGDFDPVRSFSVNSSSNPTIVLFLIKDMAHTQDIVGAHEGDPISVVLNRQAELKIILNWLN